MSSTPAVEQSGPESGEALQGQGDGRRILQVRERRQGVLLLKGSGSERTSRKRRMFQRAGTGTKIMQDMKFVRKQ